MDFISDTPNPILSGKSLTLTCTVELSAVGVVDVPLSISTWLVGPDGSSLRYTSRPIRLSFTHYTSTAVLSYIDLADSGEYTCTINIGSEITMSANHSVIVGRYTY